MNGRNVALEEAGNTSAPALNWGKPKKRDILPKPFDSISKPRDRSAGWVAYGDLVAVVVLDDDQQPKICTGFICSSQADDGDKNGVDTASEVVVWFDERISLASKADCLFEETFSLRDSCLLRMDEIAFLTDPERAVAWFEGTLCADVARRISMLVAKPDFGRGDRLKQEMELQGKLKKRSDLIMATWQLHGRAPTEEELQRICPLPPLSKPVEGG